MTKSRNSGAVPVQSSESRPIRCDEYCFDRDTIAHFPVWETKQRSRRPQLYTPRVEPSILFRVRLRTHSREGCRRAVPSVIETIHRVLPCPQHSITSRKSPFPAPIAHTTVFARGCQCPELCLSVHAAIETEGHNESHLSPVCLHSQLCNTPRDHLLKHGLRWEPPCARTKICRF